MSINIPTILEGLASTAKTIEAFKNWKRATARDVWKLIEELESNSLHCWTVLDKNESVGNIVNKLSTAEYDRLRRESFDFNNIRQKKVYPYKSLGGTDLAFLGEKETKALITNIYERIKDLKNKYPFAEDGTQKRWYTRVENIQKRILLLLRHVRAQA